MALETKVPTYQRLRYFNGLFLYAADFQTESEFHLATRRHLNYLLFQPGVLYLGEAEPLGVSAVGTTTVTVAAGSAMVPDGNGRRQLHEVQLSAPVELDLASADVGAADGDTVYVTLGFDEENVFSVPASGGGSRPIKEDRKQEQAVLAASTTAPAADEAAILLAEVTFHAAGIDNEAEVGDRRARGGVRYEILSQDLIDRLGTVTPPEPTLAGIAPATVDPGATYDPVTVTGAHLRDAFAVSFHPAAGLTVTDLTVLDPEHLSFSLAVADSAAAGPRNFRVTTPGGTARSEDFEVPFEVSSIQEPPTIDEVDPPEGAQGNTVEVHVTGTNLVGASAVTFQPAGDLTVTDLEVINEELLRVVLVVADSAAPGIRTLRVTTPGGTDSTGFEITAAQARPKLYKLRPKAGQAGQWAQLFGNDIRPEDSAPGDPPTGISIRFVDPDAPHNARKVEELFVAADQSTDIGGGVIAVTQVIRLRTPARAGVLPLIVTVELSRDGQPAVCPDTFRYLR